MSLPVTVDPTSKKISVDESYVDALPEYQQKDLVEKVEQLNDLSRYMAGLTSKVPPPPNTIAKNITDQVNKLKDSGLSCTRNGKHSDALKYYSLAVQMALRRPPWEATAYVMEEVSSVLGFRADAYMSLNMWPEAFTDSSLVTLLKPADAKGHFRRGKCLEKVEKLAEARTEYQTAASILPQEPSFKTALAEIDAVIASKPL